MRRYAATHKGLVILPGINHALTSNGVPKLAYGDVPAPVLAPAEARSAMTAAVASFIMTHQVDRMRYIG